MIKVTDNRIGGGSSSKRPNNDGKERIVTAKEIDEAIDRIMREKKDVLKELGYV